MPSGTPQARFAVNPVLVPEHTSTVLISLLVGAILSTAGKLPSLPKDHFHVVAAGVTFGAVAAFLLALTLRNRWKFPAITLDADGFSTAALGITTGASLWGRVDAVEIGEVRFFGWPARVLRLKSGGVVALEAADFYFGWEKLVERAVASSRRPGTRHESLSDGAASRLMYTSMARDAMFGPRESIPMFLVRLPIRTLYVLPVAAMDFAAGLWLTASLGGDNSLPNPAAAWAAPISLAASAFVARWVSYYLSTSLTLRPLFFPTDAAQLAQVRRLEAESRRTR
ncbi:MAG: hypothetical protein FD180_1651 [Planctomycetota bacterium]|nr:MAG: hypothetical protein FD180_1651 [Planctomycetota bacterium]